MTFFYIHRLQIHNESFLVCNKIFGVILTAYIDGLDAKLSKSRVKAKMGNVSELAILCIFSMV